MDQVMYFNLKYFLVLFFSFVINISVAEEIRDYYAEPGLNPFKQTMQDLNESIDPFSGTMQQKYTDIVIPGNGGLDIRINRTYTSPQDYTGAAASAYGVGWTIHFGRIVSSQTTRDKICAQGLFSVSTKDNPSLELPDGGRELLVLRDSTIFPELGANDLITRSNWKAKCGVGTGAVITSPTGISYTMNEYAGVTNGTSIEPSWFTSRIEDVNGNWIAISYIDRAATSGYKMIDEITTSDGRTVKFNYVYPDNDLAYLDKIVANEQTPNEQTWTYNYLSVNGWGAYQLIEVVRPDGNKWQYDYYPSTEQNGGRYAMKQVTYPQGGIVNYTYDKVVFNPGIDQIITTVVSSKTTSGTSITPGTWTYNYAPASYLLTDPISDIERDLDVTTVTTPTAVHKYHHLGAKAKSAVFAIGLLVFKDTYDVTGTSLKERISHLWGGRKISDENYWHGRTKLDIGTQTPILLSKTHWRDGVDYITDYKNHDRFGNVGQVVEIGNIESRTTNYTYYTDPVNWIITDKVKSETIPEIGTILREFNVDGTLKSESKYGVLTEYTYHPTGDLATVTNAKSIERSVNDVTLRYSTKFNDYYRGIAREEIHPVTDTKNITLNKIVNLTGTVKSTTNGRGFTTSFTYDDLNRLTSITYPKAGSSPVSIVYTASSKTLTRGNLEQTSTVNGFGQTINTTVKDTLKNTVISTTQYYDAIGQLIFKSNPNGTNDLQSILNILNIMVTIDISSIRDIIGAIGTSFQYDALGRQIRIDHPDSSFRVLEYLPNNKTKVTNERNQQTTYSHRSFGEPSIQSLIRIDSPESILTIIDRNKLDQQTRVWQGTENSVNGVIGYERIYEYAPNYFLKSINNPETGITLYGRDEIGNMTSKQVGASLVTLYSYDFQNRNTFIDYPNTTADVTYGYDDNGNSVQVDNQNSTRTYLYDQNDNLQTETINIGQTSSLLEYTYTNLDYVDTLTYPSGKTVNYSPDALGRPSQMAPYLTNVSYYPSGQTKQLTYANGKITDYTLNNRLWIENISVNNTVGLTYSYDGLGNINDITDSINPLNDRTFGYDGADRLTLADGQWGAGSYTYDQVGNLKTKSIGNNNLTYNYFFNKLTSVSGSSNQIFNYDLYGNKTNSITSNLVYNDASQLISSTNNNTLPVGVNALTTYLYDGNGMRVNSVNGTINTNYVFASNGNLMRVYGDFSSQEKEYFYLGSQQIAMVSMVLVPTKAVAGTDKTVVGNNTVILNGSGSTTTSGNISYAWAQTAGPTVTLSGANTVNASFIAPVVTSDIIFTFELTITDTDLGKSDTDTINITVQMLDTDQDNLDDDWETKYFGNLTQSASQDFDQDGYSNLDEFTLGLDPSVAQAVDAPTNVNLISGIDSVTLAWPDVSRATSYNIYWSTTPGVTTVNGNKIANVTPPYVHQNLTAYQDYYYIVTAENVGAGEGPSSAEAHVKIGWKIWSKELDILNFAATKTSGDGNSQIHQSSVNLGGKGGNITAVWSRTDNRFTGSGFYTSNYYIYASRLSNNGTWTAPVNIDIQDDALSGVGPFEETISIDGNLSGQTHVVWLREYPTSYQLIANRYSPSSGWSTPVSLHTLDKVGYVAIDQVQVKVNEMGNATVMWLNTQDQTIQVITKTFTQSSGWQAIPSVIADNVVSTEDIGLGAQSVYIKHPKLMMDSLGNSTVLWSKALHSGLTPNQNELIDMQLLSRTHVVTEGWSGIQSHLLNEYNALSGNHEFTSNSNGSAMLAWREYDTNSNIVIKTSIFTPETGWQLPVDHGTEVRNLYSIVIGDNGDAVIVAGQSNSADNVNGAIVVKRYIASTGWQATEYLMPTDSTRFENLSADINENGTIAIVGSRQLESNDIGPTSSGFFVGNKIFSLRKYKGEGWIVNKEISGTESIVKLAPSYADHGWTTLGHNYEPHVRISSNNSIFVLSYVDDQDLLGPATAIATNSYKRISGALPIANAGIDIQASKSSVVTLDGTGSSDVDGSIVAYEWLQVSGPAVSITNANTATAMITLPEVLQDTELHFMLKVKDGLFNSSVDLVKVTILATAVDTIPPAVTAPVAITTEATAQLTIVTLGTASANDDVDGVLTATADNTGPFAVGTHTVTWSATDAAGNVGTATQTVTVTDTTAPVVTVSTSQTVEATGQLTQVTLGAASSTDLVDGVITPTPSLTSPFTVGTHIVIWTATDSAGNMGSAAQLVTITDTTAPTVTVPVNVTLEATGALTTVSLGTATATDLVDGALTATADNSGPFAVGSHTITWSSTDAAGNVGSATQTVTISDTTAPVVTAPVAVTVEANATLTTVALGTTAANDSVDGVLTATADNVGPYGVGTHTITWSATDTAGNVGTSTQLVTVQDTTPPALTVPADVTVISDVAVAADIGTATATDIFTPVTITNNAPATFPVGVTTVTWTATDANDNVSTANQTVTVELPPGVYLTLGSTSPQTVGAVVNLSANTVGVTGSYEYRFRVKGPATGDVWQVLQAYSTTATYSWNTTSYAGKNRVQVQARPVGTTVTPLKSAKTFWVNSANAATAVDYTTNIASPQSTGAVVNITAQATGGAGSYEYQFRVKLAGAGNAWVVLQDWSTLSTASWNTTGYLGRHRVQVKARNVNSTDLAVKIARNYWVNDVNPATSAAIATDLSSPQAVGSTVVLTGTGTGGTSNYDYRFRIKGPSTGDVWQVLQDWSATGTYNWNTTGYVGSHRIQVQLKNAGTEDRPVRKALTFDVQ